MTAFLVSPESLPATGKLYVLSDQSIWLDSIAEFGMACRITSPLQAELTLFPQEEGVLARGRLTGEVAVPCNRCAEDALVRIDQDIESFEPYPPLPEPPAPRRRKTAHSGGPVSEEHTDAPDPDMDTAVMFVHPETRRIVMDIAALVWQEFSLALPVRPLCAPQCKGLCPVCGANRNKETCSCAPDTGDPRMAALRNLTLKQ